MLDLLGFRLPLQILLIKGRGSPLNQDAIPFLILVKDLFAHFLEDEGLFTVLAPVLGSQLK